jgi:hypothetical protein
LIYPKPTSYYVSPHFEGERAGVVLPPPVEFRPMVIGRDRALADRVISQLDLAMFRRSGRLHGEYLVTNWGCIALDRCGSPIRFNYDPEEDTAHNSVFSQIESYCVSQEFFGIRDQLLRNWDSLPLFDGIPVLSEWYGSKNYHHFMIRFLPQVRRYANDPSTEIGVPRELLERPFQLDLISRTYGERRVLPLPIVFRVKNPRLSYEPISQEGIDWLRSRVGLRARKGERRIYIRRGPSLVGRKGGDLVETPAFLSFLERNGFEVISFGGGELSIADQVRLLDGARVVLSPHGASLTNIVYLDPGVSVIELFARHWCHHSHMQLSMHVGLNHTSVLCELDAAFNAIPDVQDLQLALERSLDLTA